MRKNKEMENISMFLSAAEKYGVGKADLFQVNFSVSFLGQHILQKVAIEIS